METISVPTTDIVQDLSKIDVHLAELYRRTAGVEGAGAFVPFARALLLNLIVFVPGPDEMASIGGDVSAIMGTHPCRAIIVSLSGRKSDEAPASISAVCGISTRGDRRLCGEIIELYPEHPAEDLVGMIMPVLVPDAPVFVWVTHGVPCGSEMYRDIIQVTDHVIVDSRTFADLRAEWGELLDECVTQTFDKSVQDLAWVSLMTWRNLTAQHFDPPQTREYLSGLEKVTVRFARGEDAPLPPSVPLLFASWLTERTGTRFKSVSRGEAGAWSLAGRQGDHDVTIDLVPEQDGNLRGRLRSVSIQARAENGSASFYIQGVSGTEVSVTEECVGICYPPLTVELPVESEDVLAARALDNRRRDTVFEAAAAVACEILSMIGETG